jgi:hypothetical protein
MKKGELTPVVCLNIYEKEYADPALELKTLWAKKKMDGPY